MYFYGLEVVEVLVHMNLVILRKAMLPIVEQCMGKKCVYHNVTDRFSNIGR